MYIKRIYYKGLIYPMYLLIDDVIYCSTIIDIYTSISDRKYYDVITTIYRNISDKSIIWESIGIDEQNILNENFKFVNMGRYNNIVKYFDSKK